MEKTTFGKTGIEVTSLGFGGAEVGYLKTEQDRVGKILNLLLDEWVNVIDTAAGYEGSEEAIGNAISNRRGEYVLISKCGFSNVGLAGEKWSRQLIRNSIDRSLQRLKTKRIDVMLLHSCDLETLKKGEALQALLDARDAGQIRFAGYSGDNEAAAYAATLPDISVIETSISICDQANIDMVLPAARANNVGILAKRPIANAAWRRDHRGVYTGYVQTYQERFAKMNLKPEDLGFKGPPEKAWPEIALRFTLAQPGVNTAIIGTTSVENTEANIAIAEKGPLPQEAVDKIRDAFKKAEKASGAKWTGQT